MKTTCTICGKPLTDPVSMELGIGPVCRVSQKELELSKGGNLFVPRAIFEWGTTPNSPLVLWIEDLKGGKSVTNDMPHVLQDISKETTLLGKIILYKDSYGVWDQVLISPSGGIGFKSVNEKNLQAAIKKLANHAN